MRTDGESMPSCPNCDAEMARADDLERAIESWKAEEIVWDDIAAEEKRGRQAAEARVKELEKVVEAARRWAIDWKDVYGPGEDWDDKRVGLIEALAQLDGTPSPQAAPSPSSREQEGK